VKLDEQYFERLLAAEDASDRRAHRDDILLPERAGR
jgi:hypothetical protein